MIHEQWVEIRPKVKGRPRMTRRGRAYTPKTTLEYEEELRGLYDGPVFDGPISMTIDYHTNGLYLVIEDQPGFERPKYLRRGDIDNFGKAVLDGLQGAAYEDDKTIIRLEQMFINP